MLAQISLRVWSVAEVLFYFYFLWRKYVFDCCYFFLARRNRLRLTDFPLPARRALSQRRAPEHFPATPEERRNHHLRVLRELQLSKKSLHLFMSEWFKGCDPKVSRGSLQAFHRIAFRVRGSHPLRHLCSLEIAQEIKFDNVMEWAAQNMFSKRLRECSKDELDELRYISSRTSWPRAALRGL